MRRGTRFTGAICCDQPGCCYVMEFESEYTGHVLDKVCVRIDRLDYHRSEAHPEVVEAERKLAAQEWS